MIRRPRPGPAAWLAWTALVAGLVCPPVLADHGETALLAKLRERYPGTRLGSVTKTPVPGLYEVVMGDRIAYVGEDPRYLLFGHLLDLSDGQRDLTALREAEITRIDVSALPLHDAVRTVRGNGARRLIVISDPECPYCRRLESELAKLADVTIHTFVVALLGPASLSQAVALWCAPDRALAWREAMVEGRPPAPAQCAHPVERNRALAERLGVKATPTLIAGDGRVLAGARSAGELDAWLSAAEGGAKGSAKTFAGGGSQ